MEISLRETKKKMKERRPVGFEREIQVCVHSRGFSRLDLASDSRLLTRQNATRVKHAESWRVTTAGALQDKKDSLACQLFRDSNSRLIPFASESPEHPVLQKNVFSHSSRTLL